MTRHDLTRRRFLTGGSAGVASLLLAGCDQLDALGNAHSRVRQILAAANGLTYRVQRLLAGDALAQEFAETEIRQAQRPNGSVDPDSPAYLALKAGGFAGYRLRVTGAVGRPLSLSLAELQAMPARSQITRHDCVEGWSGIARWTGVPLGFLLAQADVRPQARFVVFHCFDNLGGGLSGAIPYYESCDLAGRAAPADRFSPTASTAPHFRFATVLRSASGSSGSPATRWRNTSIPSSLPKASPTSAAAAADTGRTRPGTTGTAGSRHHTSTENLSVSVIMGSFVAQPHFRGCRRATHDCAGLGQGQSADSGNAMSAKGGEPGLLIVVQRGLDRVHPIAPDKGLQRPRIGIDEPECLRNGMAGVDRPLLRHVVGPGRRR